MNLAYVRASTFAALVWLILAFPVFDVAAISMNVKDASKRVLLSEAPVWIKTINVNPIQVAELRYPEHYHLVQRHTKVGKSHKYYSHFAYTITDPAGLSEGAEVKLWFNPSYETLNIHNVKVIRNGRLLNKLSMEDVRIINSEDSQNKHIYSGEFVAIIQLENVRVGDLIEYDFTIEGSNPIFDNNFSHLNSLGWGIPVDEVDITVTTQDSRPLNFNVFGSTQDVSIVNNNKEISYSVALKNTKPALAEDMLPSWYRVSPYIEFSEYSAWQDVATWANDLFKTDKAVADEYISFMSELKALSKEEALNRVVNYVQNDIRYLGIEIGVNSHLPSTPEEVFLRKYGDCKDKSLLLVSLLNELDIEAHVALVSTENQRALSEYLPSHGLFNHAITRIRWKGEDYWIDPTISHQGKNALKMYQPDYEMALIINSDSKSLVEVSINNEDNNTIDIEELIVAPDFVSPVEWHIQSHFTGYEAESMRYRLKSSGKEALATQYINYYAKIFPRIKELTSLTVEDDETKNRLSITEHYLIPGFWEANDESGSNFTIYADYSDQYLEVPKTIIRKQPIVTGLKGMIKHSSTLQFPEDINFSHATFEEVDESEHLKFVSSLKYDRRRLTFENILTKKAKSVDAADVPDYLSQVKKIKNKMSYQNSITNVASEVGYDEMKSLIEHLNTKRVQFMQTDRAGTE